MATSRRNSTEPMTAPAMMKPELPHADERLADDDAGQAPDHHADAHLHVGEALILRQQRARQRDRPFDSARPSTIMFSTFTPSARIICALSPVACIAVPRFVRKNA